MNFKIDNSKSYSESNFFNKIYRQYLKWKFDIDYEISKLFGKSHICYIHPECTIQHVSRNDMASCKIRTFSEFTERRVIEK